MVDPRRQIEAVTGLLRQLHARQFYGEVIVRMESGNVLYTRIQEIKRIEDMIQEAEARQTPP